DEHQQHDERNIPPDALHRRSPPDVRRLCAAMSASSRFFSSPRRCLYVSSSSSPLSKATSTRTISSLSISISEAARDRAANGSVPTAGSIEADPPAAAASS